MDFHCENDPDGPLLLYPELFRVLFAFWWNECRERPACQVWDEPNAWGLSPWGVAWLAPPKPHLAGCALCASSHVRAEVRPPGIILLRSTSTSASASTYEYSTMPQLALGIRVMYYAIDTSLSIIRGSSSSSSSSSSSRVAE